MRFFMVILRCLIFVIISDLMVAPCQHVVHSEESDLFLLRIISVDEAHHEMVLEMVDGDKNVDEPLVYIFKSVPQSLKKGDLIRIWGNIEKKADLDRSGGVKSSENSDGTGEDQIRQRLVIRGSIAGTSYRTDYDPTGVRKRLKLRISPHQPPPGGAGRAQP